LALEGREVGPDLRLEEKAQLDDEMDGGGEDR
jgi:hypothetical protein